MSVHREDLVRVEAQLREVIMLHDRRYEQRFIDSDRAVASALSAAKEATGKAETASDKRFEGVNEFRATLSDQQRTLMPRAEAELRTANFNERLSKLELARTAEDAQRKGGSTLWAYVTAAVGILFGLIAVLSDVFARQGP